MVDQYLQNPKMGYSVSGVFKGYRSEVRGEFINHYIGVQVGERVLNYGDVEVDVADIEIPKDQVARLQPLFADLKDRHVKIWYYPYLQKGTSKKGQNFAFTKNMMIKDSVIELLDKPKG